MDEPRINGQAPAPATTPAPAPHDFAAEPIRIKLSKSIMSYGQSIDEISFRVPTAADILRCGIPAMINPFDDPPRMDFRPREMNAMMAALANVPSNSLAQLTPGDWLACAWSVSRFFMPTPGAEVPPAAN